MKKDIENNYPLHWGGHGYEVKQKEVAFDAEELLRRAKKLADDVEVDLNKPLEGDGDEPIIKHNEGYEKYGNKA